VPTYTLQKRLTQPNESEEAREQLVTFLRHVDGLGLTIASIVLLGSGRVQVTTPQTIPPEQVTHLGLT